MRGRDIVFYFLSCFVVVSRGSYFQVDDFDNLLQDVFGSSTS
jgi:hypothetical protein